jgi:hypothetical protein
MFYCRCLLVSLARCSGVHRQHQRWRSCQVACCVHAPSGSQSSAGQPPLRAHASQNMYGASVYCCERCHREHQFQCTCHSVCASAPARIGLAPPYPAIERACKLGVQRHRSAGAAGSNTQCAQALPPARIALIARDSGWYHGYGKKVKPQKVCFISVSVHSQSFPRPIWVCGEADLVDEIHSSRFNYAFTVVKLRFS